MRSINDLDCNKNYWQETTGERILPPNIHFARSTFIILIDSVIVIFLKLPYKRREVLSKLLRYVLEADENQAMLYDETKFK